MLLLLRLFRFPFSWYTLRSMVMERQGEKLPHCDKSGEIYVVEHVLKTSKNADVFKKKNPTKIFSVL